MTLTSIPGYIIHQEPMIAKSILTDKKTLCLLKALRASSSEVSIPNAKTIERRELWLDNISSTFILYISKWF